MESLAAGNESREVSRRLESEQHLNLSRECIALFSPIDTTRIPRKTRKRTPSDISESSNQSQKRTKLSGTQDDNETSNNETSNDRLMLAVREVVTTARNDANTNPDSYGPSEIALIKECAAKLNGAGDDVAHNDRLKCKKEKDATFKYLRDVILFSQTLSQYSRQLRDAVLERYKGIIYRTPSEHRRDLFNSNRDQVTHLKQQIIDMKSKVGKLEMQKEQYEKQISEQENKENEQESRIRDLKQTNADFAVKVTGLKTENDQLKDALVELNKELEEKRTELESLLAAVETLLPTHDRKSIEKIGEKIGLGKLD